jgi:hypothetical protein
VHLSLFNEGARERERPHVPGEGIADEVENVHSSLEERQVVVLDAAVGD